MSAPLSLFLTTPRGLEGVLADEVRSLGGRSVRPVSAGVACRGWLETALRLVFWSRVASRVLLNLGEVEAADADALYQGVAAMPWEEHIPPDGTLAVDFMGGNAALRHTTFGAMKVKDAVVDRLRAQTGRRPGVDLEQPSVRLNVALRGERATLSLDLAGLSLHRRGYRQESGEAPLKENLAAAILLLAGWPALAAAGGSFLDPMAGSGVLPIEAALMAGDIAPGLLRPWHGCAGWLGHDPSVWQRLRREAEERLQAGLPRLPAIYGSDADPQVIALARRNAARAGLEQRVRLEVNDLAHLTPPAGLPGLVAVNPPYGVRMGEGGGAVIELYQQLGERLRRQFGQWRWAVLGTDPELGRALGDRLPDPLPLYNGPLACSLWLAGASGQPAPAPVPAASRERAREAPVRSPMPPSGQGEEPVTPAVVLGAGGEMVANRLRKNLRHLSRWATREAVGCYRVYDADLPEYAAAVDLYQTLDGSGRWAVVQEYQAPAEVDAERARERLAELLAAVARELEAPPQQVVLKVRRKGRGGERYGRLASEERYYQVNEGGLRYWVNFTDHLDTGLFLDHRPTRALLQEMAAGKRFLNLFGYTGSATVAAAAGGARESLTVDLSLTYLHWAQRNLALNRLDQPGHRLLQADCREWLVEAGREGARYDLIFLDPPTFSNSARMEGELDLLRDHPTLIDDAAQLLAPGGILLFSTNARRLRLDPRSLPSGLLSEDLSRRTLPPDFARSPHIHRCWKLQWQE